MPFVLGKRVLIFFAQLLPYSVPQAPPETSKLPRLGDDAGKLLRFQTWEIQLGLGSVDYSNERDLHVNNP
jgi:hypothetical protein